MAQIRKREGKNGVSWQIDYFDPEGKRVRKSFRKKKDAEAELGKRVSLMAEGRYLDVKKECKTTLGELIQRYIENYGHQASYQTYKKYFLAEIKEHFDEKTIISNIRYVDIETYFNKFRTKVTKMGKPLSNPSINRRISCFHHLFTKGKEWDLIEESPFDRGKLEKGKENKRIRYLLKEEIPKLLDACTKPYLRRIVVCAINTGMDLGVILGLKWENIRNGYIYTIRKKTQRPLEIPINDELKELFREIRQEQGLTSQYVFTKNGHRIRSIHTVFTATVKKAGIHDFTFRDLRHTFASHLAMNGRPLKEIQELMGHENITMTMRYAHLGPEQKADAVNSLNGLTGYVSQNCHKNKMAIPSN